MTTLSDLQYPILSSAQRNYDKQYNTTANYANYVNSLVNKYINSAVESQQYSNEFNHYEAELNRDFQAAMSSTAHQREVADLKAAGLSPVLSANAGASTPAGSATATSDNLTNLFGNFAMTALSAASNMSEYLLSQQGNQLNTAVNANVQVFQAKLSSITSEQVAHIAGQYGLSQAEVYAAASRYSAQLAYDASVIASQLNYDANMAQVKATISNTSWNNLTSLKVAKQNNDTSAMNANKALIGSLVGSVLGLVDFF